MDRQQRIFGKVSDKYPGLQIKDDAIGQEPHFVLFAVEVKYDIAVGYAVFYSWRYFRIYGAHYHAICFESAQSIGEHFLGNVGNQLPRWCILIVNWLAPVPLSYKIDRMESGLNHSTLCIGGLSYLRSTGVAVAELPCAVRSQSLDRSTVLTGELIATMPVSFGQEDRRNSRLW